nr:MAG TPA: hypothetical protein [Caudoviricetes sp.]
MQRREILAYPLHSRGLQSFQILALHQYTV